MSLISLGNVLVRADLAHSYKHRLSLSSKLKRKAVAEKPTRTDAPSQARPKRIFARPSTDSSTK
jgi:hypothetical protein